MVQEAIAGVKKIEFDFEFTYSKNGDDDIGNTIVVREPSYEDMDVHASMTSHVTKALFAAMPQIEGISAVAADNDDDKSAAQSEQSADQNTLSLMALGMSASDYGAFLKYVQKKLTNNARFAHIDGEEIPITDLLWRDIGQKGGPAAINKILAAFVTFFIEAMNEKKAA